MIRPVVDLVQDLQACTSRAPGVSNPIVQPVARMVRRRLLLPIPCRLSLPPGAADGASRAARGGAIRGTTRTAAALATGTHPPSANFSLILRPHRRALARPRRLPLERARRARRAAAIGPLAELPGPHKSVHNLTLLFRLLGYEEGRRAALTPSSASDWPMKKRALSQQGRAGFLYASTINWTRRATTSKHTELPNLPGRRRRRNKVFPSEHVM